MLLSIFIATAGVAQAMYGTHHAIREFQEMKRLAAINEQVAQTVEQHDDDEEKRTPKGQVNYSF